MSFVILSLFVIVTVIIPHTPSTTMCSGAPFTVQNLNITIVKSSSSSTYTSKISSQISGVMDTTKDTFRLFRWTTGSSASCAQPTRYSVVLKPNRRSVDNAMRSMYFRGNMTTPRSGVYVLCHYELVGSVWKPVGGSMSNLTFRGVPIAVAPNVALLTVKFRSQKVVINVTGYGLDGTTDAAYLVEAGSSRGTKDCYPRKGNIILKPLSPRVPCNGACTLTQWYTNGILPRVPYVVCYKPAGTSAYRVVGTNITTRVKNTRSRSPTSEPTMTLTVTADHTISSTWTDDDTLSATFSDSISSEQTLSSTVTDEKSMTFSRRSRTHSLSFESTLSMTLTDEESQTKSYRTKTQTITDDDTLSLTRRSKSHSLTDDRSSTYSVTDDETMSLSKRSKTLSESATSDITISSTATNELTLSRTERSKTHSVTSDQSMTATLTDEDTLTKTRRSETHSVTSDHTATMSNSVEKTLSQTMTQDRTMTGTITDEDTLTRTRRSKSHSVTSDHSATATVTDEETLTRTRRSKTHSVTSDHSATSTVTDEETLTKTKRSATKTRTYDHTQTMSSTIDNTLTLSHTVTKERTLTATVTHDPTLTYVTFTDTITKTVEATLTATPSDDNTRTLTRTQSYSDTFSFSPTFEQVSEDATQSGTDTKTESRVKSISGTHTDTDIITETQTRSRTGDKSRSRSESDERSMTQSTTLRISSGRFYLELLGSIADFDDSASQSIIITVQDLYPVLLTGHVFIPYTVPSWNVVVLDVKDIPYEQWENVRAMIMRVALPGVDGYPYDASLPIEAPYPEVQSTLITVCDSRAVLNAIAPNVGKGWWSVGTLQTTSDVLPLIVNPKDPQSPVVNVSVGQSQLTWNTKWLYARANVNVTVNRMQPPTVFAGSDASATSNYTLSATPVAAPGIGKWSVLIGRADVVNITSPTSLVAGQGTVTLKWEVTHPLCPTAFSVVTVTFPSPSTCTASITCNNHGLCDGTDNTCRCYNTDAYGYYDGINCERCKAGYVGTECKTPNTCQEKTATCWKGLCEASTGKCLCFNNATLGYWTGAFCDTCQPGWSGANCAVCAPTRFGPNCSVYCDDTLTCSGHGVCGSDGTCVCASDTSNGYWEGSSCSLCAAYYSGSTCTQYCQTATTCSGHGTCRRTAGSSACTCFNDNTNGYWATVSGQSQECSVCKAGYITSTCQVPVNMCGSWLSCNNGVCNDENGTCTCYASSEQGYWGGWNCSVCASDGVLGYWDGPQCSTCRAGYYGTSCSKECMFSRCNGHGTCSISSQGACTCYTNAIDGYWSGNGCAKCTAGYYGANCTVKCVPSETCFQGKCNVVTGACECYNNATFGYWSGMGCSACVAGYNIDKKCTQCRTGYFGAQCSVFCDSIGTCSGHGVCNSTGGCDCHKEPNGRGMWAGDVCDRCDTGYTDSSCRTLVVSCKTPLTTGVSTAMYSDTFTTLDITFTQPTDQGAASGRINSVNCATWFTAPLLPSIVLCKCYFVNSLLFRIDSCPYSANSIPPKVGDAVSFKTGAVRAIDSVTGSSACSDVSIELYNVARVPRITAPSTGRVPVVVVNARSEIESCEGLDVDIGSSTFTSPRMNVSYTVLTENRLSLRNYLNQLSSDTIRVSIPSSIITTGSTQIAITLTDYYTGMQSSTKFTVTKSARTAPALSRLGSERRSIVSTEPLELSVVGATSPCGGTAQQSSTLTYSWISSTALPRSANVARPTLSIPARTLLGGSTYTFTVSATDVLGVSSNTVTFTITVGYAPLQVTLVQGSSFTVDINRGFTLTALLVDPDATSEIETLTWECSRCPSLIRSSLLGASNKNSKEISFIAPLGTSAYTGDIVLTYAKSSTSRQAKATFALNVTQAATLGSVVNGPPTSQAVSASDRIVFEGTTSSSGSLSVKWRCVAPCPRRNTVDSTSYLVGTTDFTFVIAPNVLYPSTSYTIEATFTGGDITEVVKYTIVTRAIPNGGTFVAPVFGKGLQNVVLTAPGWVTASDAYPLRYCFSYMDETWREVSFGDCVSTPYMTVINYQSETPQDLGQYKLVVIDRQNQTAVTFSSCLTLSQSNADPDQLYSSMVSSTMSSAQRTGDYRNVMQSLAAVGSVVRASDTQASSALVSSVVKAVDPTVLTSNALRSQYASVVAEVVEEGPSLASQLRDVISLAHTLVPTTDDKTETSSHDSLVRVLDAVGSTLSNSKLTTSSNDARNNAINGIEVSSRIAGSLTMSKAVGEISQATTETMSISCRVVDTTKRSTNGISVGNVELVGSPKQGTLSLCTTQWSNNILQNVRTKQNTSSILTSVNMISGLSATEQNDIQFRVKIPSSLTRSELLRRNRTRSLECSFYNFTLRQYSRQGCALLGVDVVAKPYSVVCLCNHMTDFVSTNPLNFNPPTAPIVVILTPVTPGGMIVVGILGIIALAMLVVSFVMDQYFQHSFGSRIKKDKTATGTVTQPDELPKARAIHRSVDLSKSWLIAQIGSSTRLLNPWLLGTFFMKYSSYTQPRRVWTLIVLMYCAFFFAGLFPDNHIIHYVGSTVLAFVSTPFLWLLTGWIFSRTARSSFDARYDANERGDLSHSVHYMVTTTPERPDHRRAAEDFLHRASVMGGQVIHKVPGISPRPSEAAAVEVEDVVKLTAQSTHPIVFSAGELADIEFGFRKNGRMLSAVAVRAVMYTSNPITESTPDCDVISLVIAEWLGMMVDPADPFFMKEGVTNTPKALQFMWAWEANTVVWRLAIEAVRVNELRLAASLFETALILVAPELIFVLHSTGLLESQEAVLEWLCQHSCMEKSVGRLWVCFYAKALMQASPESIEEGFATSGAVNRNVLIALLGLQHRTHFAALGGVGYDLLLEHEPNTPNLMLDNTLQNSYVLAAHLIRLQPKIVSEASGKSASAALFDATSTTPQPDVLDVVNTLIDKGGVLPSTPRLEAHDRVYEPFKREWNQDHSQTNLYSTIEYARLVLMMYIRQRHGCSYLRFGEQYLEEEAHLRLLTTFTKLRPHAEKSWADASSDGFITWPHRQGNNHAVGDAHGLRNTILVYLVNARITETLQARCVTAELEDKHSLLSNIYPPILRGTGSAIAPHVGWDSLLEELRMGDRVYMFAGCYPPLILEHVHSPRWLPIVFSPFRFTSDVSQELTLGKITIENALQQCDAVQIRPTLATGRRVFSATDCTNIHVEGLVLTGPVGVVSMRSTGIEVKHCCLNVAYASIHDQRKDPAPDATNYAVPVDVSSTSLLFREVLLPPMWSCFGYVLCGLIGALLVAGCLYVSAVMTVDGIQVWIIKGVVTCLLNAFVLFPLVTAVHIVYRYAGRHSKLRASNGK